MIPAITLRKCASLPRELSGCSYFLSVNRYERKKSVETAILGFSKLRNRFGPHVFEKHNLRLVICGGYDPRLPENVQYYDELAYLAFVGIPAGIDGRTRAFRSSFCSCGTAGRI